MNVFTWSLSAHVRCDGKFWSPEVFPLLKIEKPSCSSQLLEASLLTGDFIAGSFFPSLPASLRNAPHVSRGLLIVKRQLDKFYRRKVRVKKFVKKRNFILFHC